MARKKQIKRGRPIKVAPEVSREIKLFVYGCDSIDGKTFYRKVSTEAQLKIAQSAINGGLMRKAKTANGKRVAILTEEGRALYDSIDEVGGLV